MLSLCVPRRCVCGNGGKPPRILDLGTILGWLVSVSQPSSFIPWATFGDTIRIRDWVCSQSVSTLFGTYKSHKSAGNRTTIPRKSSPWRVRYNDWTISAPEDSSRHAECHSCIYTTYILYKQLWALENSVGNPDAAVTNLVSANNLADSNEQMSQVPDAYHSNRSWHAAMEGRIRIRKRRLSWRFKRHSHSLLI